MVKVVKKDGSTEDFQGEKIVRACEGCGTTREDADMIASEIEKEVYDGIKTSEIRDKILEKLRAIDPDLEIAWIEYEREKVK